MSVQVRNGIWCAAAVIIAFMFFLGCSPVGASEGYAHVHDPDDGSVIYVTPTPVPTLTPPPEDCETHSHRSGIINPAIPGITVHSHWPPCDDAHPTPTPTPTPAPPTPTPAPQSGCIAWDGTLVVCPVSESVNAYTDDCAVRSSTQYDPPPNSIPRGPGNGFTATRTTVSTPCRSTVTETEYVWEEGATSGMNCYRDPRSRRITGCFVPDEE